MLRLRLDKLVFSIFFLLGLYPAQSQEVLTSVSLEKINSGLYRVRFKLNPDSALETKAVELKIFRRRAGVIDEIFSKNILDDMEIIQGSYRYKWNVQDGLVKTGDELQARIKVSSKPATAKQKSKINKAPYADAGEFLQVELPVQRVLLNGSNSRDEDGKITSVQWQQTSGPTTLLIQKNSLMPQVVGEFKEGSYAFELIIKDDQGDSSIGRTILTVKPAPQTEKIVVTPMLPKKDSLLVASRNAPPPPKVVTRLKGGPLNTVINVLVPGVGHYFVSGDHNGENRKATAFIVTAAYIGSIGGAFYFNEKSSGQYKKYNELAGYREMQKDANGVIIGVRGANEAEANKFFNNARDARRNSLICLGVGGGILLGDVVYTFIKGNKNKKAWKESTSFKPRLFIEADQYNTTVGLQFKF